MATNFAANQRISRLFRQVATYLEKEHANPYRVQAYRAAARNFERWPEDVRAMLERNEPLSILPRVGSELAEKAEEILQKGYTTFHTEAGLNLPTYLLELLQVPGIGPQRAWQIYRTLRITSHRALQQAAEKGKLHEVPGLGPQLEHQIKDFYHR